MLPETLTIGKLYQSSISKKIFNKSFGSFSINESCGWLNQGCLFVLLQSEEKTDNENLLMDLSYFSFKILTNEGVAGWVDYAAWEIRSIKLCS